MQPSPFSAEIEKTGPFQPNFSTNSQIFCALSDSSSRSILLTTSYLGFSKSASSYFLSSSTMAFASFTGSASSS